MECRAISWSGARNVISRGALTRRTPARAKPRGDTAGEGSAAHCGDLGEMEIMVLHVWWSPSASLVVPVREAPRASSQRCDRVARAAGAAADIAAQLRSARSAVAAVDIAASFTTATFTAASFTAATFTVASFTMERAAWYISANRGRHCCRASSCDERCRVCGPADANATSTCKYAALSGDAAAA